MINIVVGGLRVLGEQRDGRHDLAGLAEPALRHAELDPGALHRMIAGGRQSLDRRDRVAGSAAERRDARADGAAVEVHRAGTAQRLAAAELGAGEAEHVAQHPQQWHVFVGVDLAGDSVDRERDHRLTSSGQAAPVSIQAWTSAPSSAWLPGAGARPAPGFQPQPTSGSGATWSWIWAGVRPPLRAGSFSCAQICAGDLSSHTICAGARCQSGAPGTRASSTLRSWWQVMQPSAGMPRSAVPRSTGGSCSAWASPWRGVSSGGWQFTQRAWVRTRLASTNIACERSVGSEIASN